MRPITPFLLVSAALTFAAGCGHPTPAAPRPRPVPQRPQTPPPAQPQPMPAEAEGRFLLAGLRQAFTACRGVEAEVSSVSEGHYKAGKRVSELRKNRYRSRLVWAKPNRFRGDILHTDNFLVSGAKMVSQDGKNITVKAGGVLGLFPLQLSADADMLASNRNHKFGDMTPEAMLTWILSPSARWVVVGQSLSAGVPVKEIRVENIRHLDPGISEERIVIEPGTFKLHRLIMNAGTKTVVDYQFTRFRWNPVVADDTFEL